MIITGHQPNYLPYLGFFHKIAKADVFVIVDNVQFVKRGPFGWIHRNRIRTSDGWGWLTVPVMTRGKFTQNINEVLIDNQLPWQRKHWKSIEWHYKSAPYFNKYKDIFSGIYGQKYEYLSELNEKIIATMLGLLGLKTRVEKTSALKTSGKAAELIINFCRQLGGTSYISGIHGRDYLKQDLFGAGGIELIFQDFSHPVYEQVYKEKFEPYMSTLDLLFNYGDNSMDVIMNGAGKGFVDGNLREETGEYD